MKYKNYYKILELKGPSASDDEIKSSYRKLTKKYHPDKNPGNKEIEEMFKDINEAFQALKDKKTRKRYNIRYRFHTIQNLDVNEGFANLSQIFMGYEDEEAPQYDDTIVKVSYDETITLSLSAKDAKEGAVKSIKYSMADGKTKNITLKVPTGAENGTKIKLQGEGRRSPEGTKGDLYVIVDIY